MLYILFEPTPHSGDSRPGKAGAKATVAGEELFRFGGAELLRVTALVVGRF